jgi:uncharacterized protein YbjQ (UPF0145 family)
LWGESLRRWQRPNRGLNDHARHANGVPGFGYLAAVAAQICLEGDLAVDGAGGLLGWKKRQAGVLAELQAAAPEAQVNIEGTKLSVYLAEDAVEGVHSRLEGILGTSGVNVVFRLWQLNDTGEWTLANHGAKLDAAPVMILTTNDAPGYEIVELHGEIFGITVRTRNLFSRWGADMKSLIGGELGGMTKLLATSRDEAMERLRQAARQKGANAILAFRFDSSEIGEHWNEICAYGTAATIRPIEVTTLPPHS